MMILGYILLTIYLLALMAITIFCLMQFHLLYAYSKAQVKYKERPALPEDQATWPLVTIQLPIYNEQFVVERLIDNITNIDYPKEKLQIHILDDSTDETLQISQRKAKQYREQGFDIQVITRSDRKGYKAGALKQGMVVAKGDFIAIFDADFLPKSDFLRNTIPQFSDPKIGVVQTRWEHLNQTHSLITELQAFQLNVHFTVEQRGRYDGNYFLQFNGTAGVWRRATIEDAGGWEADTLTEDLDLSYRAQMKGWKILFMERIVAPAELPQEMNGLKSQQYRWMKGGAETAKKILPKVWQSKLSPSKKIHATMHLLSSSVFICVFLVGVFSVPLLFVLEPLGITRDILSVFLISLLSILIVYYVANVGVAWPREHKAKMILKFVLLFPIFLALSMGLSFHNTIAVLQGYIGRETPFVRTPKFGFQHLKGSLKNSSYFRYGISGITIMEGLLALYFCAAIIGAYYVQNWTFILLHGLLVVGYGATCYYSLKHARQYRS